MDPVMLWEVAIEPAGGHQDREADRVQTAARGLGLSSVQMVRSGRSFLVQGDADAEHIERLARTALADPVVETFAVHALPATNGVPAGSRLLNVLFKPGVTDNVGLSTRDALAAAGWNVSAVATVRTYRINDDATDVDLDRLRTKVLANDAIEEIVDGPLRLDTISLGKPYRFDLKTVAIRSMKDDALIALSRDGQIYLSLTEMRTIRDHFVALARDPTDCELETIAQTWSEHCSHKTLGGRIRYQDERGTTVFDNMLKETIFAATQSIRERLGPDDWCVSVFKDNAGIIRFEDETNVCFKVETHNHPSAIEPYGGANTGLGGVIRDTLGTGLGGKPVCSTDVFCFAPPDTPESSLPPGVLSPLAVMRGVVAGVRDYGNRMGIPTVNGAVCFDERYLGNPLVYCGNVAMIPVNASDKTVKPGDLIVALGGRTGRDGIHGATFSSAELTEDSETVSGGAVQIGNAITEKMVADALLAARDRGLFRAVTDCGAGGFSSAVGEMGEETGAEVDLDLAPLKYSGLSYTEIWISEAQERMVLAVPPEKADELIDLCTAEGVEASILGRFTGTGRLVLKYEGHVVGDLSMEFLHGGRPPVVREATYAPVPAVPLVAPPKARYDDDLAAILGSWNVCSKERIIRQYDHEVQAGSVVKPLVGVNEDGPSDAAVIRPDLRSRRGLVISCGMNPRYGDLDPYWMAAAAIDEAVRNCVAVGADPDRIAILDNFCWGNTDRPETLGSLVRAALACRDVALAYGTPFISGKDSLNNEFSYTAADGTRRTVAIPPSLLISALGQIDDVAAAVTMDLKQSGNDLYLVGETRDELGGSHYALVNGLNGGQVPTLDPSKSRTMFAALHTAMRQRIVRSCHDLSEGGLAVAAAEMAFAGGLGLDLDLSVLTAGGLSDLALLFAESNTRFLAEVCPENSAAFEAIIGSEPCRRLGTVTAENRLRIHGTGGEFVIDSSIGELKTAWQRPLSALSG
ncbi:MAG: phosphoribosylformylglycinamidine synthase subunit PurL [Planctomycetaceae bacterium]